MFRSFHIQPVWDSLRLILQQGSEKKLETCITLRYQPEEGPPEERDARFETEDVDELWRRIRHNVGQAARILRTGRTDTIRFRQKHAVPAVVRYHYDGTILTPELRGGLLRFKKSAIPVGIVVAEDHHRDKSPILLLLESPHLAEASCDLVGWRPAVSSTGLQLQSRLWVLAYCLAQISAVGLDGAPVIICNPLPFPASLRVTPVDSDLRDAVFETAMAMDGIKKLFRDSLDRYNPLVIINACTKEMQPVVQDLVDQWFASKKAKVQRHRYQKKEGMVWGETTGATKPTRYLVELLHPAHWHTIPKANWFVNRKADGPGFEPNQEFSTWLAQHEQELKLHLKS